MMLPSVCVATLRGCTARPGSRSRWCRPTILRPAPGRTGCLAGWANLRSSAPTQRIRTHARRTMCRSAADVLSTSPKSAITLASDRDIGRGRHTRSTGGSTRRRRGRENPPSRPTIWGMTVVDRPTISEQFSGRFHAHGLADRWRMPSIYIHFCTKPRCTPRSARPVRRKKSAICWTVSPRASQGFPGRGFRATGRARTFVLARTTNYEGG